MPGRNSVGDLEAGSPAGPWVPVRRRMVARGEERQLAVLRWWVSGLFPACPARDDVVLVADELASNAIRHTASGRDGWFAVEITWYRTLVRVAVADCGGPNEPVVIEDPGGESGRGLFLVQQLAAGMGISGNRSGRLVWADITWAASCHAEQSRACDAAASGTVRQCPGPSGGVRQQA